MGVKYRADLFLPREEEFRRAMFCPEIERERKALAFEASRMEERLSQTANIFSAEPVYGSRGYRFCLELDPFQIQDLAQGKGKAFAEYLAREMINAVLRGAVWEKQS